MVTPRKDIGMIEQNLIGKIDYGQPMVVKIRDRSNLKNIHDAVYGNFAVRCSLEEREKIKENWIEIITAINAQVDEILTRDE